MLLFFKVFCIFIAVEVQEQDEEGKDKKRKSAEMDE